MNEVALNDVGSKFKVLIAGLGPGDEVVVVQDGERVATNRDDAKKKATTYDPGTNVQDRNLSGIEHFRTRKSGHSSNLREPRIENDS